MERNDVRNLLEGVAAGSTSVDDALAKLAVAPARELGYATLDTARGLRTGAGEVVYGAGKTAEQIAGIVEALVEESGRAFVTRVDGEKADAVFGRLSASVAARIKYHADARILSAGEPAGPCGRRYVCVACAGTSDLYCAEEAALTAEWLGSRVERVYDVGVSGLHRLLAKAEVIQGASCVVAVAGMEGALASVVGGLAPCPVIAVPTSVGYGAAFDGLAALLAMLNSCASGVSVVNIDNGFGAGYQAALIDRAQSRA